MTKSALMESCEERRLLAFSGQFPATFGSTEFEIIQEVLALPDGRTVVAGIYSEGAAFATGQTAPNPKGDTDGFVALLSTTGQLQWVRTFGGIEDEIREEDDRMDFVTRPLRAGEPAPRGISTYPIDAGENITGLALAGDGSILVTGIFRGVATFGSTTLDADRSVVGDGNYYDSFILRYSTGGRLQQVRQIGGPFNDVVTSIDTDDAGNVYLAGSFERRANFALTGRAQIKEPNGRQDIFAVKYDPTLTNTIWFAGMGGDADELPEIELAQDLAVDDSGNVYLAGTFSTEADFDPRASRQYVLEVEDARTAAFTMRLSPTGNLVWAKSQVGKEFVGNSAVTIGNDGSIYTVGYFEDEANLNDNQPSRTFTATPEDGDSSADETDLFITKWSRNAGRTQWVKQISGNEYEVVSGIEFTANNRLAVWGSASGEIDFDPNRTQKILTTPEGGIDDSNGDRDFAYAGFVATYRTDGSIDNARLINPRGEEKDLFIQAGALRPDGRSFVLGGRFQGGINITRVGSPGPAFNLDVPLDDYRDDGFVLLLDRTLNRV
jgi:Beta-propeller repeat